MSKQVITIVTASNHNSCELGPGQSPQFYALVSLSHTYSAPLFIILCSESPVCSYVHQFTATFTSLHLSSVCDYSGQFTNSTATVTSLQLKSPSYSWSPGYIYSHHVTAIFTRLQLQSPVYSYSHHPTTGHQATSTVTTLQLYSSGYSYSHQSSRQIYSPAAIFTSLQLYPPAYSFNHLSSLQLCSPAYRFNHQCTATLPLKCIPVVP